MMVCYFLRGYVEPLMKLSVLPLEEEPWPDLPLQRPWAKKIYHWAHINSGYFLRYSETNQYTRAEKRLTECYWQH